MTATAAEGNPLTAAECIELAKAPMREIYERGHHMDREARLEEVAIAQVWATLATAYALTEARAKDEVASPVPLPDPTMELWSARLTVRENEVLNAIAEGKKRAEIAQTLGISEHTLRTHAQAVIRKTGTTSMVAAIAFVRAEMRNVRIA